MQGGDDVGVGVVVVIGIGIGVEMGWLWWLCQSCIDFFDDV